MYDIIITIISSSCSSSRAHAFDKMAAFFLGSESQEGKDCFAGVKDEKMEKLLMKLKDGSRENIKKEIVVGFTKATLLEFRRKLFEMAVKKEESKMDGRNTSWDELPDDPLDNSRDPSSWGLMNRRTKPSVADDSIVLALFIEDPQGDFPMQIVKGLPAKSNDVDNTAEKENEIDEESSASENSVFEEDIEQTPKQPTQEGGKPKENVVTPEKKTERFVIRETETRSEQNRDIEIPVTVTALCDSATETDDLFSCASSATQTEEEMFQEHESDLSDSSFNEEVTETSDRRPTMNNDDKQTQDTIRELRERCEQAERRLDDEEKRHKNEVFEIRREYKSIRQDFSRLEKDHCPNKGTDDQVTIIEDEYILTQDTQGVPLYTKKSSMHRDLEIQDAKEDSIAKEKEVSRKQRMEDAEGNIVNTGQSTDGNNNGRKTLRKYNLNRTDQRDSRSKTREVRKSAPKLQVMTGNAKRWAARRKEPETTDRRIELYCGERDTKRRKLDAPVKQPAGDIHSSRTTTATTSKNVSKPDDSGSNNDITCNQDKRTVRESYSEVAEKGEWNTHKSKAALKKEKKSKKVLPPISGFFNEGSKELYVRGLSCKAFRTRKDLEESIRSHCIAKDVYPIFQRVIAFHTSKPTVGCKLIVKEDDEHAVRSSNFWPRGVSAREWYEKPIDSNSSSEKDSSDESN